MIRIHTWLLHVVVLIETYWNVNIIATLVLDFLEAVLIETYWNVNIYAGSNPARVVCVLIETYWNVNVSS